jgi:hypothetical protein
VAYDDGGNSQEQMYTLLSSLHPTGTMLRLPAELTTASHAVEPPTAPPADDPPRRRREPPPGFVRNLVTLCFRKQKLNRDPLKWSSRGVLKALDIPEVIPATVPMLSRPLLLAGDFTQTSREAIIRRNNHLRHSEIRP